MVLAMSLVTPGASIVIGLVLLSSSIPKLRRPRGFVITVLQYQVLPERLARVYGWWLPPVELLLALLVLSGVAIRIAALVAIALFCSFIVAVSINLARHRVIDCGCFGEGDRSIGRRVLLLDFGLLALTCTLAFLSPSWGSIAEWSPYRLADASAHPLFLGVSGCALLAAWVVGGARLIPVGHGGRRMRTRGEY